MRLRDGIHHVRRALVRASIQNSQDQPNHVLQNKGFERRLNILTLRRKVVSGDVRNFADPLEKDR